MEIQTEGPLNSEAQKSVTCVKVLQISSIVVFVLSPIFIMGIQELGAQPASKRNYGPII